jgi:hypothetical protein
MATTLARSRSSSRAAITVARQSAGRAAWVAAPFLEAVTPAHQDGVAVVEKGFAHLGRSRVGRLGQGESHGGRVVALVGTVEVTAATPTHATRVPGSCAGSRAVMSRSKGLPSSVSASARVPNTPATGCTLKSGCNPGINTPAFRWAASVWIPSAALRRPVPAGRRGRCRNRRPDRAARCRWRSTGRRCAGCGR